MSESEIKSAIRIKEIPPACPKCGSTINRKMSSDLCGPCLHANQDERDKKAEACAKTFEHESHQDVARMVYREAWNAAMEYIDGKSEKAVSK